MNAVFLVLCRLADRDPDAMSDEYGAGGWTWSYALEH